MKSTLKFLLLALETTRYLSKERKHFIKHHSDWFCRYTLVYLSASGEFRIPPYHLIVI